MVLWYFVKNGITKWYYCNSQSYSKTTGGFLQYLENALIHQHNENSIWSYQAAYYWDVSMCARNIFDFFYFKSDFPVII